MANNELIYDVIHALKENLSWSTLNAGNIPEFVPITGYDDSTPPFVLYSFISRMEDDERYYFLNDTLRFYVYDNDIDRMWAISRAIREYLNIGDDVNGLKGDIPTDSRYRIVFSGLVSAIAMPPIEREGFASTVNEFRMKYLLL